MKRITCLAVFISFLLAAQFQVAEISAADEQQIEREWQEKKTLWEAKILAGATNLQEDLRKSGFDPDKNKDALRDFVQWGSAGLKQKYEEADNAFKRAIDSDKDTAVRKRDIVREEIVMAKNDIAKKTFLQSYNYSIRGAQDVKISGNQSSCTMTIGMPFYSRAAVRPSSTSNYVVPMESFPISFPMLGLSVTKMEYSWNGVFPYSFYLSVTGSAENIRELVDNTDQFLVRVRFKNLRDGHLNYTGTFVDIQKIEIIDRLQERAAFERVTLQELQSR